MSASHGVVLGRRGHAIRVLVAGQCVEATIRGRLKYADGSRLVAGDRVDLTIEPNGQAQIEAILPRRSVLTRRAGDARRDKPVAANIDGVLVVTAAAKPDSNPRLLDRLLVIAEANHLPAALVLNKIDLDGSVLETLRARYEPAGYTILSTSTKRGVGIDALRDRLLGRTTVLTGPSGVGKSSLLNAIEAGLGLRTREVSEYWGTGKHTTVAAELVPITGGGFVVDTPGLREVALWGVAPEELPRCFPEFAPYVEHCRFANCRHLAEPDCAVRDAARAETIHPDRMTTYARLREEAEAVARSWN